MVRKISLLIFLVGIILIEVYLRLNGAVPGFVSIPFEKKCPYVTLMPKEALEEDQIMICDSNGINKFNRFNTLASIRPLNSEGFRCYYEFSQSFIDSEKAKGKNVVLFIGDSWTYGLNADSGYSFASILNRSTKYTVLNAGIPGTDLPQYKAIVKEYILTGKLKPDKVVVCISRNDLRNIPVRKLTPGVLIQFCTNAGGFNSYFPDQDTVLENAKDAYAYILDQYTIVGILGEGLPTYIIGKSVLLSRLVGWLARAPFIREISHDSSFNQEKECPRNTPQEDPTEWLVQDIQTDCDRANIPVVFILLPNKFGAAEGVEPKLKNVVSLSNKLLSPDDYPTGNDDHPTNSGHFKLSVALKKILDNNEQEK